MSLLSDYVNAALKEAHCEKLEDGQIFVSLPAFRGAWASGASKREALAEMREVLEEWIVAALRDDEDLPEFDGLSLNFAGKRWPGRSLAASSSQSSKR